MPPIAPLIVLLLATATAPALDLVPLTTPPGSIAVSGAARVLAVPDEVVVTLAAEAFEKDLALAKTATDAAIVATRAAARELGVAEERMQTDAIDIAVSWHGPGSLPAYGAEHRYFKVRRGLVVTLAAPDQLDALLTRALAGGITSVDGIAFRSTRLAEHRAAARLQAAQAARSKAEALAGALGARLGHPLSIGEQGDRWSWGGWNRRSGSAYGQMQNVQVQIDGGGQAGSDGSVAPGRIAIDAEIHVQFQLAAPAP